MEERAAGSPAPGPGCCREVQAGPRVWSAVSLLPYSQPSSASIPEVLLWARPAGFVAEAQSTG